MSELGGSSGDATNIEGVNKDGAELSWQRLAGPRPTNLSQTGISAIQGLSGGVDQSPNEPLEPTEQDFSQQYRAARMVGMHALGVATERAKGGYSMQFLDPGKFPGDEVRVLLPKTDEKPRTADEVTRVRKAAMSLALEAAVQILDARVVGNAVIESPDSLKGIQTFLIRGRAFMTALEAQEPAVVQQAAREVFARSKNIGTDQVPTDEDAISKWANATLLRAATRIQAKTKAVQEAKDLKFRG